MAPHHWQQLKEILGEALEREGDDRTTFVAQRCGADTTLRHEVESYLKNSGQTVEACAEKMRETLLNKLPSEWIGQRLGAYRIVQEIGRGGMGTVFLAARADGQFEKQVAIKLLKRGTDTDEVVRRFRAEKQILAQLEHPSIARLLDAGTTDDGLPYFVMELVAGEPVTKYVREQRLSIPQRLNLFLKVCAAVERAHRDRIVHRDLKPSNILVSAEGEPKLLDFGIAKLLEPSTDALEPTATSQQRLTPICASPEQARGEQVTVATDVYALGALLYEVLTEKSPYEFSSVRPSPEEITRVICEEEPVAPSLVVSDPERRRVLHGDLDNIVLFALRKERAKRYPSIRDFAEDIQRYLAAQPIEAHPRTTAYRVRHFFNGNRGVARRYALAAAIILGVAGALFVVSPKWRRSAVPTETAGSQEVVPINDKSIAVLPFDSFNNEKDSSYFVDGVQDDILTDLAKVSDLRVISRDAVISYRGVGKKSAREIGRLLGVAHVLEGSVQKSGGRVRLNARLINARTNTQEWAEGYERKIDDLFSLQSELAQAIVTQLKAALSPSEKAAIESRPTGDMEAYDLYLQARDLASQLADKGGENWKKATELADMAIARDPTFTLAYCLKSQAHIFLYRYFDHTAARLSQAKEAAEKALKLAPDLPESHLALARYYYNGFRDYERAQQELNLIAPTLRGKVEYLDMAAITERRFGHWKDAVRDGEKAVALNPRDPILSSVLFETYLALRDYAQANRVIDNAIANAPPASSASLWAHKVDVALAAGDLDKAQAALEAMPMKGRWQKSMAATVAMYRRQYPEAVRLIEAATSDESADPIYLLIEGQIQSLVGNAEKARGAYTKAKDSLDASLRERPNDPLLSGYLASAYAGLGQKDIAVNIAKRAVDAAPISRDSIDGVNCISLLADVYSMTGEPEAALRELEKIVGIPLGPTYGDLRFNPEWDKFRKDARFTSILRQAASPPAIE